MMHHYLTLTYKNKGGEVKNEEIEVVGIRNDVLRAGAKHLAAKGLDYRAIIKAEIRCPAWAGLGLGY